jgi:hypothetical protein
MAFAQGNSGNSASSGTTQITFAEVKITGAGEPIQTLTVRVTGPDATSLDYLSATPVESSRLSTVYLTPSAGSGNGNGNTVVYSATGNFDLAKDANGDVNLYLAAQKIPRPLSAIQVKIKGR